MTALRSYVGGSVGLAGRRGHAGARRGDRRGGRAGLAERHRHARGAGVRPRPSAARALRELTFHERAALLKAVGGMLREHREELYALSARTGATLYDSKFDIDGGIGVAAQLRQQGQARAAERHRSTSRAPLEPLGQGRRSSSASTSSRRCAASPCRSTPSTSRSGVRWRSSRPAFLAGVPSLVKPASQTAYLTARLVELIVGSGLLPEGALQLRLRQRRRPARPPRASRTCSASPARRRPRSGCARTRPWWRGRCGSTPRPTR